jgi:hypothetical protein
MMRPLVFLSILLSLFLLAGNLSARAEPTNTSGLIFNGGFEGGFYPVGGGQVADGWTRVNLSGNPLWQSTQVFAGGGWVEKIEGENSHILSVENLSVGQPYNTVLYTRITGLNPGNPYSFSGWVLKMWGGSAAPNPPTNPTALGSWMGYDLTGNTDPNAPTVVWGNAHYQTERPRWVNRRMAFTATGDSITLFVRVQLSEQRAETQVIVDAMELFDAPRATLHTPNGYISTPRLDFSGVVPPSLQERGNYQLYYKIEKRDPADGSWDTLIDEIQSDAIDLPLTRGESVMVRIEPYSKQPPGDNPPLNWPPTTHVGVPTAPITVTYGDPPASKMLLTLLLRRQ